MTDSTPRKRRNRNPTNATTRLSDDQLVVMGNLFPGFDVWYRRTHDADGKLLPEARILGLRPPKESENENNDD